MPQMALKMNLSMKMTAAFVESSTVNGYMMGIMHLWSYMKKRYGNFFFFYAQSMRMVIAGPNLTERKTTTKHKQTTTNKN